MAWCCKLGSFAKAQPTVQQPIPKEGGIRGATKCPLPKSLTLVVPGHGMSSRTPLLTASLSKISAQLKGIGVAFSCVVFVYSPSVQKGAITGCEVRFGAGLWTQFILQLSIGSTEVVALMLDDIDIHHVNMRAFLQTMHAARLDVASAAVHRWRWSIMRPLSNCAVHRTRFIDPLFVIYTNAAYRCWRSLLDLELDRNGWGTAYVYARRCNASLGVLDEHVVEHRGGAGPQRSYNTSEAEAGMRRYLRYHWGKNMSEEKFDKALVTFKRNEEGHMARDVAR
eukprot:CAMPEP_0119327096 /NCGR_PEP_ID=MMETSP1333-20130426/69906_1 /TAXON_ID=418940 /ORGANISM="Scyphosphaera apsteinii, Strain RCC1455" /LENGTH=280 /DNA_ID=CAMNT_0007335581 /DNA_START=207 /DNA_END=1050 /DNA_ORIENTATION=-